MTRAGLTTEQLKTKAVPPSGLSLLGLVRHLAEVERSWFRNVLNGEKSRSPWTAPGAAEFADFDVNTADPDEAFEVWHRECARSRKIVEAETRPRPGRTSARGAGSPAGPMGNVRRPPPQSWVLRRSAPSRPPRGRRAAGAGRR